MPRITPGPPLCRRAARRVAVRSTANLPAYAEDLRLYRERCRRCGSRYAVVRLTFDLTGVARVERTATRECVRCGRTFRTVAADMPASTPRGQAVRITLLLPDTVRRWHSHGAWHREGDDAQTLTDACLADADEARREWSVRNGRYQAARDRAAARKAAADAAAHEATMALLERLHALDAARAEEEAAAAAREAAVA